jgi:hypothetical protein
LTHHLISDDNADMKLRPCSAQARIIAIAVATTLLGLGSLSSAHAQTQTQTQTAPVQKGTSMSAHAAGPFDVKLAPQSDDKVGDPTVGRMSIDKQYHGDLEAISKGQMLTAMTEIKGSAGYVAIERVTGTLRTASGVRSGSFALQHTGTMNRGVPLLSITVVPDSGTGQLAGLTGKMSINIADGKHSYDFEYALPDAP